MRQQQSTGIALAVPTVHLNGTNGDDLLEQVNEAERALDEALRSLRACAPNQRDYYPQGSEAWKRAIDQHCARVDRLVDVATELEQLAEAIANGGHKA